MEVATPPLALCAAARTDVGKSRSNNEDAYIISDLVSGAVFPSGTQGQWMEISGRPVLLAVSDGMGGHQAGEIASALVVERLRQALQPGQEGQASDTMRKIEEAVNRASQAVADAAKGKQSGMGATLTAVFVDGKEAYFAEVGDSRAYLLRTGRLRQVTRDQSLAEMLIVAGALDPKDAENSTHRNVILQAMGRGDQLRVDICRLQLRRQDRILICSDGVSNALKEKDIQAILAGNSPQDACERLIDMANAAGGRDNLTAVVAHFEGEDLVHAQDMESVTSTLEALQEFGPQHVRGMGLSASPGPAKSRPVEPAAPVAAAQPGPAEVAVAAAAEVAPKAESAAPAPVVKEPTPLPATAPKAQAAQDNMPPAQRGAPAPIAAQPAPAAAVAVPAHHAAHSAETMLVSVDEPAPRAAAKAAPAAAVQAAAPTARAPEVNSANDPIARGLAAAALVLALLALVAALRGG